MKKYLILVCLAFITISCYNSNKTVEVKYTHPLLKPYDSTANIFDDDKYFKKNILKFIEEYGPMSFRKENNEWYIYRYEASIIYTGTRFKLFRVPLDSLYMTNYKRMEIFDKYFNVSPYEDNKNRYLIDYSFKLNNIYCAEGIDYDYKNKDYKDYKLIHDINIDEFGFNNYDTDMIESVDGSAIAINTTNHRIKNIKLKISIYDNILDGKLVTEDIFLVNDTLNINELKIISISYKPHKKFKGKGLTPGNIEIIYYEKF